jgi:hypothetical protein
MAAASVEKTEAETSIPLKPESLCDPGANVPTSTTVVPVEELHDKTEETEKQAEQEMKSNAVTQNKDEEEEGEENADKEEGDKPSEPDSNKSESVPVLEVQSSSPKPDQFDRNKTESVEVSSDNDAKDRQQKENDGKVS